MHATDVDRISELANIGAGHAATALAHLAGRVVRMSVPRVEALKVGEADGTATTGVFFELDGGLGAVMGILFTHDERDAVVRQLLGCEPEGDQAESVLAEVGNILASHAASAIADTLGDRVLPSIPRLAMDGAAGELLALAAERPGAHAIRIECELRDETGEIGGCLVLVPDETDG